MRSRTGRAGTLLTLLLTASCGNGTDPAPPPSGADTWISGVELTAVGVGEEPIVLEPPAQGMFFPGTPPVESQGPMIRISPIIPDVGTGTDVEYDFTTYARNNIVKFYVWVGEGTGYWEVTLPQSAGSIIYGVGMKVTIRIAEDAPVGSFYLRTTATDTLGLTGSVANVRTVVFQSDTGVQVPDVSAVLSWAGGSDLDLHVIDPFGHDLSPFIPSTPEGGRLEPDASGACVTDTTSQEIATWSKGKAPAGEYRVIVNYYADCGEPAVVPFTVRLRSKGEAHRELTGSFNETAAGSSPDTVATFSIRE